MRARNLPSFRTLFVSHTGQWGGGAEIMLGQMIEAVASSGGQVELAAPTGPLGSHLPLPPSNIHILPLAPPRRSRKALTLLTLTVRWLVGTIRLTALIWQRRPDVIHANSGAAALQCCLAALLTRRPLVWHQYDIIPWRRVNQVALAPCGYLSRTVIACSEAVRESLLRLSLPAVRITVLHNRVREEFFEPLPDRKSARASLGLDSAIPVIVTVGRLVPYKSHRTAIDAVAVLRRQGLRVKLLVLGEAPAIGPGDANPFPGYSAALRKRGEQEDVAGDVQFLGHRGDVREVLAAADILVHPAIEDSFPIALLEAQASGVPAIASASGGHMEAIEHERTGLLFPAGDAVALAAAIRLLLSDPALAKCLAAAAQEAASVRFRPKDLGDLLDRIYRGMWPADVSAGHVATV